MSDISITAANVIAAAGGSTKQGQAGETITAGMPVYQDPTSHKWMKADCNSATAVARQAGGIALCGAALNQPIVVLLSGDVTIGGTLVAGEPYYLSGTAGGIRPKADLTTGDYVCLLGLAKSTTVLSLAIQFPGVVEP